MARGEPHRKPVGGAFDLTDGDVERAWKEILDGFRPPKGRATAAWRALGEKYLSLGQRSTSG
jgi:hypothetical protein